MRKKYLLHIVSLVLLSLPSTSLAAIAFDNATSTGVNSDTSSTAVLNVTSSANTLLLASVISQNQVSGVTNGGSAMTKIMDFNSAHNAWSSMWCIVAPPSGSNTIKASFSTGAATLMVESYAGVNQSCTLDNTASSAPALASTTVAISLTTVADNAWVTGFFNSNQAAAPTAGANTTARTSNAGGAIDYSGMLADNNGPKTPAGSVTLNANGSNGFWTTIAVSLAPAAVSVSAKMTFSWINDE